MHLQIVAPIKKKHVDALHVHVVALDHANTFIYKKDPSVRTIQTLRRCCRAVA